MIAAAVADVLELLAPPAADSPSGALDAPPWSAPSPPEALRCRRYRVRRQAAAVIAGAAAGALAAGSDVAELLLAVADVVDVV